MPGRAPCAEVYDSAQGTFLVAVSVPEMLTFAFIFFSSWQCNSLSFLQKLSWAATVPFLL